MKKKKDLATGFTPRQYMERANYEVYYYNDSTPAHVAMHQHDYYEFYLFLEGNVDYEVEDQRYHLEYGDFLLIPPAIRHRPVFLDSSIPYRRLVLWVSTPYYEKLCKSSPDFSYAFDHIKKTRTYHYRTEFVPLQELQGQLTELIEENLNTRPFRELSMELRLCRFLLSINRIIYDRLHLVAAAPSNLLYVNICDYINDHLEDDLSLDVLASHFFISKYHISHVFKDNMGISLHQYVLKKRLHACKNGILSGIPLNRIFQQYGFSDYSSFYRAFRKEYGKSPTEFREQHAKLLK